MNTHITTLRDLRTVVQMDAKHDPEGAAKVAALDAAIAAPELPGAQPVAWVRRHPDGALTSEILPHAEIEAVRRESGAWVPLQIAPQPAAQPSDAEIDAIWKEGALRKDLEPSIRGQFRWAARTLLARFATQPQPFGNAGEFAMLAGYQEWYRNRFGESINTERDAGCQDAWKQGYRAALAARPEAIPSSRDNAWRELFWDVAKELKCLPSCFVDANEHVLKAARAALAAQPSGHVPRERDASEPAGSQGLVREALEVARNGLAWYRAECPDRVDGSDDEADELIERAIRQLDALPSGQAVESEPQVLRDEQAAAVMPLIGPLLDAWEGAGHDERDAMDECGVGEHLRAIMAGMDGNRPMVDVTPPATRRDRWMYEQGRLAERDPRTAGSLAAELATQLSEKCSTGVAPLRSALAELVGLQDIKQRMAKIAAAPTYLGSDALLAEHDQLATDYSKRRPAAWDAARAALAQPSGQAQWDAEAIGRWKRDSELLCAIQECGWDVRFLTTSNGDDSDIGIEIVSHFMAKPHERVIGENWQENLRAALEQAMTAPAYPPARPDYEAARQGEGGAA